MDNNKNFQDRQDEYQEPYTSQRIRPDLESNAIKVGRAIRLHWGIENQLHWTIDVTFAEDKCRVRSAHAPQNLALLRRVALNALNQEQSFRRSTRQKSNRAAMDNDYRNILKLLGVIM